ncbi:MAG: hypothetical protein WC547_01185 [Candidatus Omnitrophota bacterium]
MILKPEGYDSATAYTGEFETLEPGGYVCVIKQAEDTLTAKGIKMLTISFDIAEGESKGFYERQWESNASNAARKWRGTYNQITDGKSVPFFKGMITSIEESNNGYKWNWDEASLKGKLFGGVFGREQYRKNDGSVGMVTKCIAIRSVKTVRDGIEPPADKLLPPVTDAYGMPPPLASVPTAKWESVASDDDLPF